MYTLTLLAQSDAGSLPNFGNINVSGLGVGGILAIIGVLALLFFAFLAAYLIFFLMDVYDWGMRREEEFPQGFLQKKKWFFLLYLNVFSLPLIIVPYLGAVVVSIAALVNVVLVFIYFFSIRRLPRVNKKIKDKKRKKGEEQ